MSFSHVTGNSQVVVEIFASWIAAIAVPISRMSMFYGIMSLIPLILSIPNFKRSTTKAYPISSIHL